MIYWRNSKLDFNIEKLIASLELKPNKKPSQNQRPLDESVLRHFKKRSK